MADLLHQLKAALEQFWDERALEPTGGEPSSVEELLEPIESMTAVEVLLVLDKVVGKELPNSLIQAGGYKTKGEFVEHLSAGVVSYLSAEK